MRISAPLRQNSRNGSVYRDEFRSFTGRSARVLFFENLSIFSGFFERIIVRA